jgi:transposase
LLDNKPLKARAQYLCNKALPNRKSQKMFLTPEQVDLLPSEELRPLLKKLLAEFETLRQRVAALEAENERLKQQLNKSANSRNSSQPPSRDQKTNQPQKKHRKHGPPFGHQKFSRPLVDNPDRVIQVPVTECEHCLADLSGVAPDDFERRQITELPAAKPIVIETRQHRATCPHCLTLNRGVLPEGLEAERYFGPNLEATVVFYKQTQHLSYERIVVSTSMKNFYMLVRIGKGALEAIQTRAFNKPHFPLKEPPQIAGNQSCTVRRCRCAAARAATNTANRHH